MNMFLISVIALLNNRYLQLLHNSNNHLPRACNSLKEATLMYTASNNLFFKIIQSAGATSNPKDNHLSSRCLSNLAADLARIWELSQINPSSSPISLTSRSGAGEISHSSQLCDLVNL